MEKKKNEIFLLLIEWKKIVDDANTNQQAREKANSGIDKIIEELQKPLDSRDCPGVMLIMYDLQSVKGISKFVKNTMITMEEICYSQ
jgi:hypothetical protein